MKFSHGNLAIETNKEIKQCNWKQILKFFELIVFPTLNIFRHALSNAASACKSPVR